MNQELESELNDLQESLQECKANLPINAHELDEACRRQPQLYHEIGELSTLAKSLAKRAKDTLDFLEADLKSRIRRNPEEFGLMGKVTNDAVNETLTIQESYQEAKRDLIEVSKVADGFSILVDSMGQRKSMLQSLVSLFVHKYYGNQSLLGEERELDKSFEREVEEERNLENDF